VSSIQPRWLASCSDDGTVKVWDVAMPSEPIACAQTGSKTVTDLAFHPQRRGLLLASLRAELRVEVFDVSLTPHAGGEAATVMAPWRSYDVAEEVYIAPPASATLCFHLGHVTCVCVQGAAACWHSLPDPAPPCVLMSMMSGSFHSICIRPMQPLAVSSDGSIATAPGGVLCMRSTSSKVQAAAAPNTPACHTPSPLRPPLCHVTCLRRPRGSSVRQARGKWAGG
jgi:WD40 repeat protein